MSKTQLSSELIQIFESKMKDYRKFGYVVFDWDNTCIVNDVTEILFYYFINNWLFKFKNKNIEDIIWRKIEVDRRVDRCGNYTFKQLGNEIVNLYDTLIINRNENQFHDPRVFDEFRTKLIYMYQQLNESQGNEVAYLWICNFFTGYSEDELYHLTIQGIKTESKIELHNEVYSYETKDINSIKIEKVLVKRGFRIKSDFIKLFNILRNFNMDIYICSASFEPLVKAVAMHSDFGYCVKEANIYGMKLKKNDKGLYIPEYLEDYPLSVNKGKVLIIMKYIFPKYKTSPFMIAGDSDGDYNMLTEFNDCSILLLFSSNKKSEIYRYFKDKVIQYPQQYFIV